ncbi:preprotein translocase subunit SecY [Rubripirellula obstinata]|uniref:Preprotein translocase subunit SecY n=1 Tax=Rubripirellula obstinata TaxID=406547 RepID=A0A5B1C9M3_9BACT|nr:preprotein translocase subunit SecY [Rubripirellula obstinata]
MYLKFMLMSGGPSGGGNINPNFTTADGSLFWGWQIVALVMTCGTVFLMWLGEQIDDGIGNGISLLIMAGILAQMPQAFYELIRNMKTELTGLSRGQIGIENFGVAVGSVCGCRVWSGVHYAWTTQDPNTIGQVHSRSSSLWRNSPALAIADQSSGRHADHFRKQFVDHPRIVVRCFGGNV